MLPQGKVERLRILRVFLRFASGQREDGVRSILALDLASGIRRLGSGIRQWQFWGSLLFT